MIILAISGSLRVSSSSSAIVHAAALVAPSGATVSVWDGLDTLPHFNPDLDREGDSTPSRVAELRRRVGEADALLISTPEYAHGVPGSLKNALDWLVSSSEFPGIRIALVNPSSQSFHAHDSLAETLRTMSADLPADMSVRIPVLDHSMDAASIAADPVMSVALRDVLAALAARGPRSRDV
ncbi:MAG: NADPH-dependent FMN reductase [Gemmatimonadales bacterium]